MTSMSLRRSAGLCTILLYAVGRLAYGGLLSAADSPATSTPATAPAKSHAATNALADFKSVSSRILGQRARAEGHDADLGDGSDKGTSSSTARKAALAALPLDQLRPEQRVRVEEITHSISYFRRLPKLAFAVDPDVYSYFVDHPDVAVSIWRAMNISKLQMRQTSANTYEGVTEDGTTGTVELLYQGIDKTLVLCDGLYQTTLLSKPIKARSLLLLQTSFFREADGTVYVTHRADLFVSFPSQTVEVVAKLLSPLTVNLTDRTFCEVSLFLKMMSLAMSRRPDWVEHIVSHTEGISDARRKQLLVLTAHAYTAAHPKTIVEPGEPGAASTAIAGQAPAASRLPARELPDDPAADLRGKSSARIASPDDKTPTKR